MRTRLLARLGAEANDAIDEFLSLALGYESLNTPSLEGFLHWLEKGDAEVKRDMDRGRDEVRVMTVHGAKGLEADIVILPDDTTAPASPGQRGVLLYTDEGVFFPTAGHARRAAVETGKGRKCGRGPQGARGCSTWRSPRPRDRLHIAAGFTRRNGVQERLMVSADGARSTDGSGSADARGEDAAYRRSARPTSETTADITRAAIQPVVLPDWIDRLPVEEPQRPRA